jgi:hypothetical protein
MNITSFRMKKKVRRSSPNLLASTAGREKELTTLTATTPSFPSTTTGREERRDLRPLARSWLLGALSRGLTIRVSQNRIRHGHEPQPPGIAICCHTTAA